MLRFFFLILSMIALNFAHADEAYLNKFTTYLQWSQHIPKEADPAFLSFVKEPSPLTCTLRERFLTRLAETQNWALFTPYYQEFSASHPIESIALQCSAQMALLQQGQQTLAIQNSQALWLYGYTRPKVCEELFTLLQTKHAFSNQLIEERIRLALDARQFDLAFKLLQALPTSNADINLLKAIRRKPEYITQLRPGPLHGSFYLVGLKALVANHMDVAIRLSQTQQARKLMNEKEQQHFIAHVALYKAMRGEADAKAWLKQIKPAYLTPQLTEWQIRDAILHQRWHDLIHLIEHTPAEAYPSWQYWLARAYEAQGEKDKARAIYQSLGMKRHYYGFLANIRLHRPLHFESEQTKINPNTLAIYHPITEEIRTRYQSGQTWLAAAILRAFSSELPKEERRALAYWVKHDLHWHGQAVLLSNNEDLNNELDLRFPLAHREVVKHMASTYHLDEAFIYAIIRQESLFFENVVSPAGAKGLMQLMPLTAKRITQQARIRYTNAKDLFQKDKNIEIGSAYLKELARQFKAHPVLMVAAYNAGPKQTHYWQLHHTPKEIDLWIETLPWQETRNYLKNVIAFYAVYQYRLREKTDLNAFLEPL